MRIDELRAVGDDDLAADVVIIGSGPAGLTIATELAGSPLRVLVLESGGRTATEEVDALADIENVGARRAQSDRAAGDRILGGASHTWSGRCGLLDDLDFRSRPWVSGSGWPIDAVALEPVLARAADHIGIGYGSGFTDDAFWELAGRTRPAHALDPTRLRPYFWQISRDPADPFDCKRFGAHVKDLVAPNVRVLVDATVTHIDTDPEGSRVVSLQVAGTDPRPRTVRATTFVLATGGIGNPRLLLASRRIVPEGIGNRHDMVGRYLMDHRCGAVGELNPAVADSALERFGKYVVKNPHGKHTFLHGVALSPKIQEAEGLLNCALWLQEVPAEDDPWESVKQLLRGRGDRHDARVAMTNPGLLLAGARRRLIQHTGLPHKLDRIELRCMVEQLPNPRSRVTLAERTDRLGVPLARVNWRVNPQEDHTVRRAATLAVEEFARLGYPAPALYEWARADSTQAPLLTDWAHPTGTTRMSADPSTGVVDPDCRVHGMANLFVAGSSVFPTTGHANPTLTIVALAIRLADTLRSLA
ncbi:GMC family oxidoreductase [Nocardia sp. NBC_00565]|uniref:GMC family oxidoreductase n=1 Tax=Nocardia sp. NBC_00565 TaxID=2975993 RepID=UPI002E8230A3|nr:GMC family oxidoreductase [Nocardia sp. NBC_00565]WUC03209.1 GMC family oxidoreductase [Nocardia sp. NBC_00565]